MAGAYDVTTPSRAAPWWLAAKALHQYQALRSVPSALCSSLEVLPWGSTLQGGEIPRVERLISPSVLRHSMSQLLPHQATSLHHWLLCPSLPHPRRLA